MPETKSNGYQVRDADKPERNVEEVGRIVIRANTLAKLVEKAAAHLELMEE